jgi:LAGLIDADG endonuclease
MILSPDWICGFVEGEGSFVISITKIKSSNSEQVRLFFKVTQHMKNVQLLYALKKYFGVGIVKRQTKDPEKIWEFVVSRFEHLNTKIIPFFESNKMHSTKKFDFLRFRKVAIMMHRKDHLTSEGLVKIKAIALRMNKSIAFSESECDEVECPKDSIS